MSVLIIKYQRQATCVVGDCHQAENVKNILKQLHQVEVTNEASVECHIWSMAYFSFIWFSP